MAEIKKPGYDDLVIENARLKAVQPVGQRATLYVVAIVVLCVLTVAAVVAITIVRPGVDNAAIVTTIIGITAPITLALLAAALQQVHLAANARLSQLLELTAVSSKAKGVLEGKESADK